ncbi:MAG: sulfurtransferase TusA family protein [Candidatus Krumholzibacteria bacterium]|nr:sulfurtransferase TusA family protein [Candidatus Krumholzibacteria bacterium]
MKINNEERVLAKGLNPPGPLLIVKKKMRLMHGGNLRVIVSNQAAADELIKYFRDRSAEAEIDRAGDDYHVVVDLANFKDED